MKRGVVYITWGESERTKTALQRSQGSLKDIHPSSPVETFVLKSTGGSKDLLQKSRMYELSPFEETLYLDADTVVLGRLDYGFKKAHEHGLACSICECPWARRYADGVGGDVIEYNTGVMFFTRKAKPVFKRWEYLAERIDSSIIWLDGDVPKKMQYNDQASFACAIEDTKFNPFVLPLNWNFRPIWQKAFFGPIKVWHDYADAPTFFKGVKELYEHKDALIQFHQLAK